MAVWLFTRPLVCALPFCPLERRFRLAALLCDSACDLADLQQAKARLIQRRVDYPFINHHPASNESWPPDAASSPLLLMTTNWAGEKRKASDVCETELPLRKAAHSERLAPNARGHAPNFACHPFLFVGPGAHEWGHARREGDESARQKGEGDGEPGARSNGYSMPKAPFAAAALSHTRSSTASLLGPSPLKFRLRPLAPAPLVAK